MKKKVESWLFFKGSKIKMRERFDRILGNIKSKFFFLKQNCTFEIQILILERFFG